MSPEPSENLTSPKGDATMPTDTDDATTAASHNRDGVSTVPKDPIEAERQRTGETPDVRTTADSTYDEGGQGGTPPTSTTSEGGDGTVGSSSGDNG